MVANITALRGDTLFESPNAWLAVIA